MSYKIFILT